VPARASQPTGVIPGRWSKRVGGFTFSRGPSLQERSMRRSPGFLVLCLAAVAFVVTTAVPLEGQALVASPDGRSRVTLEIRDGRLSYSLARDGRVLILPSLLGLEFRAAPPLRDGLRITDSTRQSHDEWWTQPWGEVARVHDHHNELAVDPAARRVGARGWPGDSDPAGEMSGA
jgi:glycosyl hydrolase family 97